MLLGGWARDGHQGLAWPLRLLTAGIALFSGSIYLMLAGAPRLLGFISPLGGVLLIAAWLMLAVRFFQETIAAGGSLLSMATPAPSQPRIAAAGSSPSWPSRWWRWPMPPTRTGARALVRGLRTDRGHAATHAAVGAAAYCGQLPRADAVRCARPCAHWAPGPAGALCSRPPSRPSPWDTPSASRHCRAVRSACAGTVVPACRPGRSRSSSPSAASLRCWAPRCCADCRWFARGTRRPAAAHRTFGAMAFGVLCIAFVAAYCVLGFLRSEPVKLWRWRIPTPRPAIAAGQVAVAAIDLTLSAGALYVLLPGAATHGFIAFLAIYLLRWRPASSAACPAASAYSKPCCCCCCPDGPTEQKLAAMLTYRAIYYLLPFALALPGCSRVKPGPDASRWRAARHGRAPGCGSACRSWLPWWCLPVDCCCCSPAPRLPSTIACTCCAISCRCRWWKPRTCWAAPQASAWCCWHRDCSAASTPPGM